MYKIQHSTFYSKTEICTHLLPRKSNKWKNPYLLLAWTTPSRQTTPILVNKKKKKKTPPFLFPHCSKIISVL